MVTTSGSPLDLLKPDPPMVNVSEDDEDDLESLRQAALASMLKPKVQPVKVDSQPVRAEAQPVKVETHLSQSSNLEDQNNKCKRKKKLKKEKCCSRSGQKLILLESSSCEEEEIEIEVETEVEVTDSEDEMEIEAAVKVPANIENKVPVLKVEPTPKAEDEDELNINCSEEIDEFSKFLDEFETELRGSKIASKDPQQKMRKKKVVKVMKIVKRKIPKIKEAKLTAFSSSSRCSCSCSRSPSLYRSRSPHSPYRPSSRKPLRRSRSPYARSISPPYPRRHSSPSYYRSRFPSPHKRYRSPVRRRRSDPRATKCFRCGDSTQKTLDDIFGKQKRQGDKTKDYKSDSILKSKSLPPKCSAASRRTRERREREERKERREKREREERRERIRKEEERKKREAERKKKEEEEREKELQERLKKLSFPERERVLARRRKFESSNMVLVEKKVISLKNAADPVTLPILDSKTDLTNTSNQRPVTSEALGDLISLSIEDTLDMFEEDPKPVEPISIKRSPIGFTTKDYRRERGLAADLRHKITKRQRRVRGPGPCEDSALESGSSNDVPKSRLHSDRIAKASRKKAKRLVIIVSNGPKVKSENLSVDEGTKENPSEDAIKSPSKLSSPIKSQLGNQILSKDDLQCGGRKNIQERGNQSTSGLPESDIFSAKVDEKDEKGKEASQVLDSSKEEGEIIEDDEVDIAEPQILITVDGSRSSSEDDDEALFRFFENMDKVVGLSVVDEMEVEKSDILMERMKKKNEERLKRIKEIEEDRLLHQ